MTDRPTRACRRRRAAWLAPCLAGVLVVASFLGPATVFALAAGGEAAPVDRRCSPPAYGLWRIWNWHEDAVWQLTPARPRTMEISNARARPGPGALTIAVEITGCPTGATPAVTAAVASAAGTGSERTLPLVKSRGHWTGSLVIPDFGGMVKRVLTTARLAAADTGAAACCRLSVSFAPAARDTASNAGPTDPDSLNQPAPAVETPLLTPPPLPAPQIDVKMVTRQTSSRVEDRTYHAFWLWSFGDGIAYPDPDPRNVVSTQVHPFVTPGLYTVVARSVSNQGTLLRELTWSVIMPPPLPGLPPVPLIRAFVAETVREPDVRLELAGPRKWVVGRPADFTVTVDFADPPFASRESVLVDPGCQFTVVWDKPGRFTVRAAAVVHLRYEFPESVITLVNTYVTEQEVEVYATVSTD